MVILYLNNKYKSDFIDSFTIKSALEKQEKEDKKLNRLNTL